MMKAAAVLRRNDGAATVKRLRHAALDEPGITRRRIGRHWRYFSPDGQRITGTEEIDRFNRIALPPAYTDAWYSIDPDAHVLAYGIDARGRRQYRYHPEFRAERDSLKFDRCAEFARALPKIRQRVADDMNRGDLSPERAIASIVRLLDTGSIRVGNDRYARENRSYGATTLHRRHLKLGRGKAELIFRGKSGVRRQVTLTDRQLLRFVRQVQELPGQRLFQYLQDGVTTPVTSGDVNRYIVETMGDGFSAKDFRTWTASVLAFEFLVNPRGPGLKPMLKHVAAALGNTPAVARKAYVHPVLIAAAQQPQGLDRPTLPRRKRWLTRFERGLLALLDRGPQPA